MNEEHRLRLIKQITVAKSYSFILGGVIDCMQKDGSDLEKVLANKIDELIKGNTS